MVSGFVLFLIALTSTLGYAVLRKRYPWHAGILVQAAGLLFDWIGLFTVFVLANLGAGVLIVLLVRAFTRHFVSVYEVQSVLLVILSAVQASMFLHWWKRA